MDAEVIIVGGGPTGLMLARELCLAGVRPIILERQSQVGLVLKANAIFGQILDVLRLRGLLDRVQEAAGSAIWRAPQLPFGNLYLDFSQLPEPPNWGLRIPQPELERVLDREAREQGADIRRRHEVVGLRQSDEGVFVDVIGPDGLLQMQATYVVGCDGAKSRVRTFAGIEFPGITYPEVNRLGQATLDDSVALLENGDLDVPGIGVIHRGFTRTKHGVFAIGSMVPDIFGIQTTEDEAIDVDENEPMTLTEFQESICRVLGNTFPLRDVKRLSRYGFQARQAQPYRLGRVFVAGDAAHQFPATGIGINVGMLDAVNLAWKLAGVISGWAPDGLLDSYHDERHFAGARGMMHTQAQAMLRREEDPAVDALRQLFTELMTYEEPLRHMGSIIAGTDIHYDFPNANGHPLTGTLVADATLHIDDHVTSIADLLHGARPVFLDFADRRELRAVARAWDKRVDIYTANAPDRTAGALLLRPDGYIAWAGTIDESVGVLVHGLQQALSLWFGAPDN